MIKRLVTGFLFSLMPVLVFSQQDPLFTQYMYSKLEFNPACAGSREALSVNMLGRFQWVGFPGAPKTFCLTASTPLKNPRIALGLTIYRDESGPAVDYNVMGVFAYRILFPKSALSFGISGGIKHYTIDWNMLNPRDPGDLALAEDTRNRVVPDVDFGIYYKHARYYAGLSAKHLLQNQMIVSSAPPDDGSVFTKLAINYYGIAGGMIPLSDKLDLMPSLLLKYVRNNPLQADISCRLMMMKLLTLGISYRTENALGLLASVELGKGFSLGYSYDIWFNGLNQQNRGSHEIRVSFERDLFGRGRMLTPRYF
jgi:type IX secretion system PorP/SprF family membrane protein